MKLLLIDNYDSFTYNLVQLINPEFADVMVLRNDEKTVDEIADMKPDGLMISPGPGTPDRAGICLKLIEKLHGKIPILGICLGHQAIAQHFGGKVVLAGSVVHGKSAAVHHNGHGLLKNMRDPFNAARYHSLIVEDLPEELIIDGKTEDGEIMAIHHRDGPTYGLQFHPESILTENGSELLNRFVSICEKRVHARP